MILILKQPRYCHSFFFISFFHAVQPETESPKKVTRLSFLKEEKYFHHYDFTFSFLSPILSKTIGISVGHHSLSYRLGGPEHGPRKTRAGSNIFVVIILYELNESGGSDTGFDSLFRIEIFSTREKQKSREIELGIVEGQVDRWKETGERSRGRENRRERRVELGGKDRGVDRQIAR